MDISQAKFKTTLSRGWIQVCPVINHSVRGLCAKPYHGHPKGCPNFAKKKGCPPSAALIETIFDLTKPVYAIYHCFNLKGHAEWMKQKHPQ